MKIKDMETNMILDALRRHNGNRTYAANDLGISVRTIRTKIALLKAQGYDVPDPKTGVEK